jgi:putative membrane protein
MIVKPRMSWLRMLFTIRGTSLGDSWPRILVATLIAVVVTVVQVRYNLEKYTLTPAPFTIIGVAISIFLGFRNNTAYNRFWEGRILWGGLVNACRSFTRQVFTLMEVPAGEEPALHAELTRGNAVFRNGRQKEPEALPDEFGKKLVYQTIALAHALRHHLRDTSPWPELEPLLSPPLMAYLRSQPNVPYALLHQMGAQLQQARRQGWVHAYYVPVLEESLKQMTDILGGCERIKNTPIPFTYSVLSHRIVAFFCFLLPLGLVDTAGVFTLIVVFLVSHAFLGLDVIGGVN